MKILIIALVLNLLFITRSTAQNETEYLSFTNQLLINPAFAGFNESSHFRSNIFFEAESNQNYNHALTLTYDKWNDESDSGIAWYFYHGLQGSLNTNHTGAGFTFASKTTSAKGTFTSAINLNYLFYTKQWFVFLLDEVLDKRHSPYEPPGVHFMRYNVLVPRAGLLWNSEGLITGLVATYNYRHHIGQMLRMEEPEPFNLIFHIAPIIGGNQNGLLTQPYRSIPELVFMVSNRKLITRVGFKREVPRKNVAVFLQNNFTDDQLEVTGLYGIKLHKYHIDLSVGARYSSTDNTIHPYGEISFGITIPDDRYNEEYPWAPVGSSF